MAVLLILFSSILYTYIRHSVQSELEASLIKQARYLMARFPDLSATLRDPRQQKILRQTLHIDARIASDASHGAEKLHFETLQDQNRSYLEGHFPYRTRSRTPTYLMLRYDVTQPIHMMHEVFRAIVLLNLIAMALILFVAFILSDMLIAPIHYFSRRLARMNENILESIDLEKIPKEFRPLGHSINLLVARIKSHLLYKKELFVGTAHELKTPLAVIKTRSQVALIKKEADPRQIQNALRDNIETVDRMNQMIGAILEFGRAEGAQFDHPRTFDIIAYLEKKVQEFRLLAHDEGKKVRAQLSPETLSMTLQPLLLEQILQNLLQNGLRYTPEGGVLELRSRVEGDRFILEILDEGPGIDESQDLFAPFKRGQDSPGAGLGLFLVKSAADALEAEVSLHNRGDRSGTVARVVLPIETSPTSSQTFHET